MSKVLHSKDFANQLVDVANMDWDVSESRGYPVLQQTKRNAVKQELLEGLQNTFANMLDSENNHIANIYLTDEGVAIEVENGSVGKKVEDGNGMITMVVDIKFKSLDYDAMVAADSYAEEKAQKAEAKAAKAEAKAKKVAADKAKRAAKENK